MAPKMKFSALVLLAAFWGCTGDPRVSSGEADAGSAFYQNPEFECPTAAVMEPEQGYPHPVLKFPYSSEPKRPVKDLEDFCARMQDRFKDSGLTDLEARRVLEVIPTMLNIHDEPAGMPAPGEPPPAPVDLTKRVMLRKLEEGRYEIFFFTVGCGRNYSLYELVTTSSDSEVRPLERWSEASPC